MSANPAVILRLWLPFLDDYVECISLDLDPGLKAIRFYELRRFPLLFRCFDFVQYDASQNNLPVLGSSRVLFFVSFFLAFFISYF